MLPFVGRSFFGGQTSWQLLIAIASNIHSLLLLLSGYQVGTLLLHLLHDRVSIDLELFLLFFSRGSRPAYRCRIYDVLGWVDEGGVLLSDQLLLGIVVGCELVGSGQVCWGVYQKLLRVTNFTLSLGPFHIFTGTHYRPPVTTFATSPLVRCTQLLLARELLL